VRVSGKRVAYDRLDWPESGLVSPGLPSDDTPSGA